MVPDDRITNTSICTGGFTSGPSDSVSRMIDGIGNCEIGFRGRGMTLLSDMITDAIDEVTAADLDDLRRAFDARNRSAAVFDRSAEETDGVTAASVRIPAFKTRKRSMTLLSDLITNAIDETEAYDIPRTPAFYWRTEPHTRVGWKVEHVRSLSDWSIDEELLHTEARKRHWMKKH